VNTLLARLVSRERTDSRRIALAIPTRNRAGMVAALARAQATEFRIGEICVRDNASSPDEYEQLRAGLAGLGSHVRLARNETDLGVQLNKAAVLRDCTLPWALLFDSDNQFDHRLLDAFFRPRAWSESVVYCPQRANPNFDFTPLAGRPLDRGAVAQLLQGPQHRLMLAFLNMANYLVPVRAFLQVQQPYLGAPIFGADAMLSALVWLQAGGVLQVMRRAHYVHNVHDGSYFKSVAGMSKPLVRQLAAAAATRSREALDEALARFRVGAPAPEGAAA